MTLCRCGVFSTALSRYPYPPPPVAPKPASAAAALPSASSRSLKPGSAHALATIRAPLAGDPVRYLAARISSSSASVVSPAAMTRSSSWRTRAAAGSSA